MWLAAILFLSLASHSFVVPPPRIPETPGEALHVAIRAGNSAEARRLLDAGADVNFRDSVGSTPLLDAAWVQNAELAALCLAHHADVNARQAQTSSTALYYSVLDGNVALVKLLLSAGADVSLTYRDGQTILHTAANRGRPEVVTLLLDAGADVSFRDLAGNTALDMAILHGQQAVGILLLQRGTDAKYLSPMDGRGPLHHACIRGMAGLVGPLIAAGADPSGRDHFDQTPLDIALAYKNGPVVSELLRLPPTKNQRRRPKKLWRRWSCGARPKRPGSCLKTGSI